MRSSSSTNITPRVDNTSQNEGASDIQKPPKKMTRVDVENMLTEYVRDGSSDEQRLVAKDKMLACLDALNSSLITSGLNSTPQNQDSQALTKVTLNLGSLGLKKLPEDLSFLCGIHSLVLFKNRLRELPDSIGSLLTLNTLDSSRNEIQQLPESVGNLRTLKTLQLSHNSLKSLPQSIGKLKNLVHLNVWQNKLQSLPDSICSLRSLETLELSSNQLSILPQQFGALANLCSLRIACNQLHALPDSIGLLDNVNRLDLQSNLLQTLPDSIGNLKELELLNVNNNRLQSVPETIGNLSKLVDLLLGTLGRQFYGMSAPDSNRLRTLPESIGNLQNLRVINAIHNHLSELPRNLVFLSTECAVRLDYNPLSQTVCNQLQNAIAARHALHPEQGPRIEYDMSAHNRAVVAKPLSEEIASWRAEGDVEISAVGIQALQHAVSTLLNAEADALSNQLARMRVTAHYNKTPQDLVQRVNAFLNYVEQAPDVLQTCAAIAAEGTETCDDRIALAFIQLEEAIVNHRSLNEPSLAKLVETAAGLHKSQLLQAIAQQKVSTLVGFVDPTEIILKYVVNLSKEFNLPSQLDDMIFHNCALQVSEADIQHAREEIQKQSSSENLDTFLATWQPWRKALSEQYPAEYAQTKTRVSQLHEDLHGQMETLTSQLADAKVHLGELSPQYLELVGQSNELFAQYRNIESAELVKLTQTARLSSDQFASTEN